MKSSASEKRALLNLQFHYTEMRHHLKNALISICLFSLPIDLLLNLLAGACYGY